MSIGLIILTIACVYCIILRVTTNLKKTSPKGISEKSHKRIDQKNFILNAIGAVLIFIAYMIIIPTPKAGTDRWFNSVLVLRLFWKTFGSLLAASGSFFITVGIGLLFGKKNKKKKLNWKSTDVAEAMQAFNEIYENEIKKINVDKKIHGANLHEGFYGRYSNKMEQIAKNAPLAEIRIAAIQKLRNKNQLESCLNYEKDEKVRKAIEEEIAKR